jgi:HK97 family phage major capsid protein
MSDTKDRTLLDASLSCVKKARDIDSRYPNPTEMPTEDRRQRKALLDEALRLKDLYEDQRAQKNLENWAAAPDESSPVLAAQTKAQSVDGELFTEASRRLSTQRFAKAMRLGTGALSVEEKAAIIENATGQIIVPADLAGPIFLTLPRLGVLRNLALVRPTTSNRVDVRALTQATAGWGQIEITNAGGATPPTDAAIAATGPNTVTVQDLVALVQIGVDELMDTDANLVSLVQEIVGQQFAQMEDDAFANGNGTSKPFGLATRATVGGAIPAAQGVTAAASAVVPDQLKSMQYLITSRFANNGVYLASDDATQAIALLKDSTSNYLWQPSNQAGQPDVLFGRPFYRMSGLPAMTATTFFTEPSVLFGDVRSGYMVADRQQITVQRLDERYADQGLVGFLFRQRVGGDVIRPAAFAKYLL